MTDHLANAGNPIPTLELAELLEQNALMPLDDVAAAELRRLHDLLGKSNALCRIRAERIKELERKLAEQPAQQEPVAWRTKVMLKTTGYMWNYTEAKVKGPDGKDLVDYEPLYTSPQRTQVGLTDEEIEVIAARTLFPVDFARAIEAKLKEKNT